MTIGIICAMEKEIIKYKEILNLRKTDDKAGIYVGKYQNKNIILCLAGVGKVNAAILTQYLIDNYKPDYIINSGCSGSLDKNCNILDTILVNYATYHDFKPTRIMEEYVPDNGKIKVDEYLFNLVKNILEENKLPYKIGGIASGDCFVTNDIERNRIYNETGCITVDMESASIAHTARKNNIPFIIIRSISDFADGVDEEEEKAAKIAAEITYKLIEKIK